MRSHPRPLHHPTTHKPPARRTRYRRALLALTLLAALCVWAAAASASCNFLLSWGSTGPADGQFQTPRGIAVDSAGNVYVTEASGNRVQKFSPGGTFLSKFGVPGEINGGFINAYGIAFGPSGDIYVTDSSPDRTTGLVQRFNSSGVFQNAWGIQGSGNGQFLEATGVAVDSAGNVYVADQNNQRIQKFNSTGTFLAKWGSNGSADGQLKGPQGIAIDSSDNVYVVDTGNDRIQKFDTSGTFITKWGTTGSGDGQFSAPQAIAIDGAGTVYVVDTGNNRIEKFSNTGTFIESCGTLGSGDGQFTTPEGIAADASGNYYVVDTADDRVEKFGTAASPVANAGADQIVECAGAATSVTLDGSASTPGSGTINSYSWSEGASALGTGSPLTVALSSGSHTITLTVTDTGGGSATDSLVVNVVDTTAPVIHLNGANPLTVECHTSFADPGATATDTCAGSVPVNASGTVDPNTPNTYTITYTASDGFNSASATRTVIVEDTTPPVISCPADIVVTLPPNSNATSMVVNYPAVTAADSCSSTVSVTSSPASGSVFPVGTTTVNATATDGSGHTSSCSFHVTVLYDFAGFFPPVANLPTFNVVNAGRAVPVKFSLSGNKGLAVFAPNSPSSGPVACNSNDDAGNLVDTLNAGGSSLSYDPSTDQYVYVWKTDASWAGTCRQLVVQLNDGSIHRANFKFR